MSEKNTENYQVPSINKAIDIIILLSQRPNLTLKDICKEFNFPVSTCFNILTTLENRNFIIKNQLTSQYQLGYTLMRLGIQIHDNIDVRKIALPYLHELVTKYGETGYLSAIDSSTLQGVVLERVESHKTVIVTHQVGSNFPLYASNTGKSLLSGLSQEELNDYFIKVKLVPLTENTLADEAKLRKELELIRQLGYATTHDEMEEGASGVSCPIQNYQDKVVAAISLAGPSQRMLSQIPHMISDVKQAAEKISRLLS